MQEIIIDGYPCQIKRSKKQSIQLQMTRSNELTLRLPKHCGDHHINQFIEKVRPWVHKQRQKNKNIPKPHAYQLITNESISYLGKSYSLEIIHSESDIITIKNDKLLIKTPYISLSQDDINHRYQALMSWFIKRAKDIIEDRVFIVQENMNVKSNRIRIKTLRSRWGSCSSKKNLNFNWVIVMAPLTLIDYIIVHECSHLIHLNHSPSFWKLVSQYYPRYKKARKWFHINGNSLCLNLKN